jgi:hypothetical protein
MSEFKGTPGPWATSLSEGQVWGAGGEIQVAKCRSSPGCGMLWDDVQIKANAHLIAAAAELLEALEDLVGQGECHCDSPGCNACDRTKTYSALIKKAKGET